MLDFPKLCLFFYLHSSEWGVLVVGYSLIRNQCFFAIILQFQSIKVIRVIYFSLELDTTDSDTIFTLNKGGYGNVPQTVKHILEDCRKLANRIRQFWLTGHDEVQKLYGCLEDLKHTVNYINHVDLSLLWSIRIK